MPETPCSTTPGADPLGGRPWDVRVGDSLAVLGGLPAGSVHTAVTSPPYYALRSYLPDGHPDKGRELGAEKRPYCWGWATGAPCGECYCCHLVAVFREVRRVLRDDGTLWLNVGDGHAASPSGRSRNDSRSSGLKPKDTLGIPWALAFALRADGWWLRSECIWWKPNLIPNSATDRPTRAHEQVFLLTKRGRYFFDMEAVKEPHRTASDPRNWADFRPRRGADVGGGVNDGRTRTTGPSSWPEGGRHLRSVWKVALKRYSGAHFATFPIALPSLCIRAGTSECGCCPACAAPWRRIITKDRRPTRPGAQTKVTARGEDSPSSGTSGEYSAGGRAQFRSRRETGNRDPQRHCTTTRTVGWEAGCACDAGAPVPALVLDPFAGSGTTLVACRRLGRRGLGIELSEKYAAIAWRRVEGALRETRAWPAPDAPPGLFDAPGGEEEA